MNAELRRWAYNWRVHGLPRCADRMTCHRLLWPWFEIGGNGEEAMCMDCTDRMHLRHEMDDWYLEDPGTAGLRPLG